MQVIYTVTIFYILDINRVWHGGANASNNEPIFLI